MGGVPASSGTRPHAGIYRGPSILPAFLFACFYLLVLGGRAVYVYPMPLSLCVGTENPVVLSRIGSAFLRLEAGMVPVLSPRSVSSGYCLDMAWKEAV